MQGDRHWSYWLDEDLQPNERSLRLIAAVEARLAAEQRLRELGVARRPRGHR